VRRGPRSRADAKAKEPDRQKQEEEHKGLVARVKEALGDRIKEVRLSHRLTESACCLVSDEHDLACRWRRSSRPSTRHAPAKRILELNPGHPIVATMEKLLAQDPKQPKLDEYAELLYDQALLTAGMRSRTRCASPAVSQVSWRRKADAAAAELGRQARGEGLTRWPLGRATIPGLSSSRC